MYNACGLVDFAVSAVDDPGAVADGIVTSAREDPGYFSGRMTYMAAEIYATGAAGGSGIFAEGGGFTVAPSKFDFFFGRVVTGSEHNILRSAQNVLNLSQMGITTEAQLMTVFRQAMMNGAYVETITTQYGVTVVKSVNIGNIGKINVSFFYKGGNMSVTPIVSSIIPQIFR